MAKRIVLNEVPGDRPVPEILAEIRRIYFSASARTIHKDFARAIDLLKQIPLAEDRQRATVYMEGLAEMRKEWSQRTRR